MTKRRIAELLSGADFEKVRDKLSENIEWNMYEESEFIKGRQPLLSFPTKLKSIFSQLRQTLKRPALSKTKTKSPYTVKPNLFETAKSLIL